MLHLPLPTPDVVEMHGANGLAAFELAQASFRTLALNTISIHTPDDKVDDYWAASPFESKRLSPEMQNRIAHLTLAD